MGLIDLKTNLKDLKFGNDRIYGGSSNQPYIQTPIPDQVEDRALSYDFILRGGVNAVQDSLIDVKRLGKYFIDLKSPSGLLFVAKQNLLSRTAVRTQASTGILNEGIYTPLSTLAQAGGVAFGLHVNKQGLNPFNGLSSTGDFSPDQYAGKIARETFEIENSPDGILKNRLFALYESKIQNESLGGFAKVTNVTSPDDTVNLISYQGGPGSILGIGKTNIRFADQRTGVNNPLLISNPLRFYGKEKRLPLTEYFTSAGEYRSFEDSFDKNILRFLGASDFYRKELFDSNLKPTDKLVDQSLSLASVILPNVPNTFIDPISNNTETYTQQQLEDIPGPPSQNGESFLIGDIKSGPATPGDFRKILKNQIKAPNYTTANIESRVNLGNPGTIGKPKSYTTSMASSGSYDKINASVLYQSSDPKGTSINNINNDLVKFRIGVIDNDTPSKKTYIHFRAFLDQISDSYNADWQATKYIGRGENFYTYNGFDRKVSLSWTVTAQSKKELIPMYKKLNYLASVCAPDYSKKGYMRGNIVTLTVGGYFYEQPGIITGLSYDMNEDNDSWEIGIDDSSPIQSDSTVKELPHTIRVKGFNFIPIHEFVPRLQQNTYGTFISTDTSIDNNIYGDERYIALSTGGNTNYDKPQ
jgi:hypothetical protein